MNFSKTALSTLLIAAILPGAANGKPAKHGDWFHPRELRPGPGHPSKFPIFWKTECCHPEGKGLALDGLGQLKKDSRPHTRVLVDGKWKNIYPELRERNPLQSYCDRAAERVTDLRRARARVRHIWFKGLEADAERKRLDQEAVPSFDAFLAAFEKLVEELQSLTGLPEYEAAQAALARKRFSAARERLKQAEAVRTGVLQAAMIDAMQKAQVLIERGREALDAEPAGRVLSTPAYDAKTGLYVLFGGDHLDYLKNDTWVFDPEKRKWFQKHPENAPEPRGKHAMKAAGDGTVKMSGGYFYPGKKSRYRLCGSSVWTYDIEKNTWTGPENEKAWKSDVRRYHGGAEHPSHFLKGAKPNAAANQKRLAELPANTWVDMKPPQKRAGKRDWGTMAYDPVNDLIVDWNGGHSCYCSSDAPHYHLGTNRWELPYPAEIPLGMVGASAAAVSGYSFNGNHWITNHTWDHYCYAPELKRILVVGSMSNWQWKFDPYSYIYDPVLGEWESRFRKTGGLEGVFPAGISVQPTPSGILAYTGRGQWWKLDGKAMKWMKFAKLDGKKWPKKACSDWYGMVYYPTADRILATVLPMPKGAYDGKTIFAFDLKTKQASLIHPKNTEALGEGFRYNREWRYIPDHKILICGGTLARRNKDNKKHPWTYLNDMPAYDPVNNRWLVLKFKGKPALNQSCSMHYDADRKLLWNIDNRGNVRVLKLDLEKAVSGNRTPVKE